MAAHQESIELPYNKYAPSDMPDLAWTDFANPRFNIQIEINTQLDNSNEHIAMMQWWCADDALMMHW